MNDIYDIVAQIYRKMQAQGVDVLACGGCARDTLLFQVPKDIDLVVFQNISSAALTEALEGAGFTDVQAYGDGQSEPDNDRCRDDLDYVVSAKYQGRRCDILVYTCGFNTAEEIVRTLDCYLNMVWFCPDTYQLRCIIEYPVAGSRVLPNEFTAGVDIDRQKYIAGKFPQFIHNLATKGNNDSTLPQG